MSCCFNFGVYCSPCSTNANANTITQESAVIDNSDEGIMPCSDIIQYVYRVTEDGKKYKRLYNYSKGMWIGDWIRVN